MRRIAFASFAALSSAACAPQQPHYVSLGSPGSGTLTPSQAAAPRAAAARPEYETVSVEERSATASQLRSFQTAVAAQLRDPSSAQFRYLRVVKHSDGTNALCGQLNAKNGFGGYTGYAFFYASLVLDNRNGHALTAINWIEPRSSFSSIEERCTAGASFRRPRPTL